MTYSCEVCDEWVHSKRWELGYRTCRECGEKQAREQRKSWTVAPVHKSNYVLVTNKDELKGINTKGQP